MGAGLLLLGTFVTVGYASGPEVGGFDGATVTVPAATSTTTPAYLIPMSPDTTTTPTTATTTRHVTPGAYCSTLGDAGTTATGKVDHCKPSATDSRLRWRA
jgi:hypothetical protein